jgi:sugar (pentulose or hexulose) kinase
MEPELFLGLDLSTQSLTAVVISTEAGLVRQESINFDQAYPGYSTRGGVLPSADPLQAHADPRMWIEALEEMLHRLQQEGLTRRIAAMAVSAQQQGTVYLNRQAASALSGLDPVTAMASALAGIFSRETWPISIAATGAKVLLKHRPPPCGGACRAWSSRARGSAPSHATWSSASAFTRRPGWLSARVTTPAAWWGWV